MQRRAGVGDHHDVLTRIKPGGLEGLFECPALGVGFHRAAGLRRHHEDGRFEVAVQRVPHLIGVRGVERDERRVVRGTDDLGAQRGATHAGEHNARLSLGLRSGYQRGELWKDAARGLEQLRPAKANLGFCLRLLAPQRVVLRGDATCDRVGNKGRNVGPDRLSGVARYGDSDMCSVVYANPGAEERAHFAASAPFTSCTLSTAFAATFLAVKPNFSMRSMPSALSP